jgi:hypothetical protein
MRVLVTATALTGDPETGWDGDEDGDGDGSTRAERRLLRMHWRASGGARAGIIEREQRTSDMAARRLISGGRGWPVLGWWATTRTRPGLPEGCKCVCLSATGTTPSRNSRAGAPAAC